MKENDTVIEPEVLDESGNIIGANKPPEWNDPHDHARPQGDTSGVLSGFVTFFFGFVVAIAVILFTVCILVPLALIGRIVGKQICPFRG